MNAYADFPPGDGETARLIRERDWSATLLGPITHWPAGLRAVTAMMVLSPIPMALMWGKQGIMLYNDAYAAMSGARHPDLLGSTVREGWPEARDFVDHVMDEVFAGRTLTYRDQELLLARRGTCEPVWVNLDYSPLLDDTGTPAGVFAVLTETTAVVLAQRALVAEHERFRSMFQQAPGFVAMLEGPEHVFILVNAAYDRLMGGRDVVGSGVRQAVPEAIGQGLVAALDTAYQTGKPFVAHDFKFAIMDADGGLEDHYLDFVYQPVRDPQGKVSGIFAQGYDVTERVLAEEELRRSRQEYARLNDALIAANQILSALPRERASPEG